MNKRLLITPQGEQLLDLTAEEIAQREQLVIKTEQERLERLAKEAQELTNKQSALTKLSALGLTEAEIKAIIG